MNTAAIIINLIAFVSLIIAYSQDKKKAKKALKVALVSFITMLPMLIIILLIIGLTMGFLPEDMISRLIGNKSGISGTILAGFLGSVMQIPSIFAFPLSAMLLEKGASVSVVASFILTLTMVGLITLPMEIRELGKRFAILRNVFSFFIAIIIAIIMGMIL